VREPIQVNGTPTTLDRPASSFRAILGKIAQEELPVRAGGNQRDSSNGLAAGKKRR